METGVWIMDDEREFSENKVKPSGNLGIGSFVLGTLLGAGIAFLLAPRTGVEIQGRIKRKVQQLRESAEESLSDHNSSLETRIDDLKEGLESQIRLVKDVVESGKIVTGIASQELGQLLESSKEKEEVESVLPENVRISGEMTFGEEN